jgi:hypothetical protein
MRRSNGVEVDRNRPLSPLLLVTNISRSETIVKRPSTRLSVRYRRATIVAG